MYWMVSRQSLGLGGHIDSVRQWIFQGMLEREALSGDWVRVEVEGEGSSRSVVSVEVPPLKASGSVGVCSWFVLAEGTGPPCVEPVSPMRTQRSSTPSILK